MIEKNIDINQLHSIVFYGCCLVGILVFIISMYSLVRFRYFKNNTSVPFHRSFFLEIVWTLLPFLIVIALVFPAAMLIFTAEVS